MSSYRRDRSTTTTYVIEEHFSVPRISLRGAFSAAVDRPRITIDTYQTDLSHHAHVVSVPLSFFFLPWSLRFVFDRRHYAFPHHQRERLLEGFWGIDPRIEFRFAGIAIRRGRCDVPVAVGWDIHGGLLAERRRRCFKRHWTSRRRGCRAVGRTRRRGRRGARGPLRNRDQSW
jgi:hypothetical protein